jgi:hypothetical protein
MPKIGIEDDLLRDLLGHRDTLVLAITAGMQSGEWEQVIAPFDALLVAIKRLEEAMPSGERPGA